MIYFDVLLVVFLFAYIKFNKKFNLLNPAIIFLLFHSFFVTFKGIQIFLFDAKIVSNQWYSTFVTVEEIEKAILLADISLIGFFIGFFVLKSNFIKKGKYLEVRFQNLKEKRASLLKSYLLLIIPLGIFGFFSFSFVPGVAQDEIVYETIPLILGSLGIVSALILIYEKGFKPIYLIFFFSMVIAYSLQGTLRFRVILPFVFLLLLYLKINNLKFPPVKYIVIGFLLLLLSFPLKEIGKSFQEGDSIRLTEVISDSYEEVSSGESGDLSFIEQSAAMVGAIDMKDIIFYGGTYKPILFFWVPKKIWTEKPKLNQWQFDISISGREFGELGQISMLSGESYANFRYLGVFFVSFFVARFYAFLFFVFHRVNFKHPGFLLLLLFNMVLFQVWRDGMISFIMFPITNYLPIMILYFIKKPIPVK